MRKKELDTEEVLKELLAGRRPETVSNPLSDSINFSAAQIQALRDSMSDGLVQASNVSTIEPVSAGTTVSSTPETPSIPEALEELECGGCGVPLALTGVTRTERYEGQNYAIESRRVAWDGNSLISIYRETLEESGGDRELVDDFDYACADEECEQVLTTLQVDVIRDHLPE